MSKYSLSSRLWQCGLRLCRVPGLVQVHPQGRAVAGVAARWGRLVRAGWASVMMFLSACPAVSSAQVAGTGTFPLDVRGELVVSNRYVTRTYAFSVTLQADSWRVAAATATGDYEAWSCDGSETRGYVRIPAATLGTAYAYPGDVPPIPASPAAFYLWYALASGSYAARHEPLPYLVPWDMQLALAQPVFTVDLSQSDEGWRLPQRADWIVTHHLNSKTLPPLLGGGHFPADPRTHSYDRYPEGFVVARHRVMEVFSPQHPVLPGRFSLVRQALAPKSTNASVLETYSARVTEVSAIAPLDSGTSLTGGVTLLDYRFGTSMLQRPFVTVVSNQCWPSMTNAAYAVDALAQAAELRSSENRRWHLRRLSLVLSSVLLGTVVLVSIVLYFFRKGG